SLSTQHAHSSSSPALVHTLTPATCKSSSSICLISLTLLLLSPPTSIVVLVSASGRLEEEVEQLLPPLREPVIELVVGERPKLRCPGQNSSSSLFTTFVLTESFWPARRSASFASGSGTPASSNITRPGLITKTHPSGEPLPDPIRVSAGFFVKLLSGKTLI